ncbi:MAG: TMEM175 family protein [Sphingomonadaceae bacterium]|nr:TMEM175 family protein [Sphingomonadaceae bacterium]
MLQTLDRQDVTVAREHSRLERLSFFSDAVFAIAITLLVIEVKVPEHLEPFSSDALWVALGKVAPSMLGFAISFVVIAAMWSAHHDTMSLLRRCDRPLVWRNFAHLFGIAALPFFTGIVAHYAPLRAGTQLYLGAFLYVTLTQFWLMRLAFQPGRYLADDVEPSRTLGYARRSVGLSLAVVVSIGLSFVQPALGVLALMTIPVFLRIASSPRWDRARA